MRKTLTLTATAVSLAITIAVPTAAQARFGAGAIADVVAGTPSAQTVQYYGGYGYRAYRPYYAPRYYGGGYYSDYYRLGYPGSRDSLNTCAYC